MTMKSTRIAFEGLDVFVTEGVMGDEYTMNFPPDFVSPYVTMYAEGTIERTMSNYPGGSDPLVAPALGGLAVKLFPPNPGTVVCKITSPTYKHYCVSHPGRIKFIPRAKVELGAGEIFEVPVGSILLIGLGAAECNGQPLTAPALVEAATKACVVTATAPVFAACFVRPVL